MSGVTAHNYTGKEVWDITVWPTDSFEAAMEEYLSQAVDVTTRDIGIERPDGVIDIVVPKGTRYPTASPFHWRLRLPEGGMQQVKLTVRQGEGKLTKASEILGELLLDLPPGLNRSTAVEMSIHLDSDSAMVVSAYLSDQPLNAVSARIERFKQGSQAVSERLESPGEQDIRGVIVCDVCSGGVNNRQGFLLTTRQVVTNKNYWEYAFTHQWSHYARTDPEGRSLAILASQQASMGSAWLVCERCIDLFGVDTQQARFCCERWRSNMQTYLQPGGGPAPFQESFEAACAGWELASGRTPARAREGKAFATALYSAYLRRTGMTAASQPSASEARRVMVTFAVTVPPATPKGDPVFLSGNFNGWDPSKARMTRRAGKYAKRIEFTDGEVIEYKYTRGSWGTVEKEHNGRDRPNRVLRVSGTSGRTMRVNDAVEGWADIPDV